MKKLFVTLSVAVALVACNNSSETTTTGDSTMKTGDSVNTMNTTPSTTDSTNMISHDSSKMMSHDSSSMMSKDTTKK